jgi:ABC-type nitrate/sulfonate/bicarbonate transport system substrate-binding protein
MKNERSGDMAMDRLTRRTALAGAACTALGAMTAACSKPEKNGDGSPIKILSSQGAQVLTIAALVEQMGYYKQFKLSPEVLAVASGTNIVGPLLTGEADVCIFAGFSQLLAAMEKGAELKIIAGASIKGQQALFSANPAVRSVKDLVGKSVGTGAVGAQLHQVVTALLKKYGVEPSQVNFVNVGSSNDVFRAVVAKRVDAGNGQADILGSLEKLGVHMLSDGEYANELPLYTWQAAFTSKTTLAAKRDELVRTLAAFCKAFRYVQQGASRDDFIKAQLDALKPTNRETASEQALSQWNYLQSHKIYAEDLIISPERVQYMQELNVALGLQKRIMPYDQIIDTSLARDAVALLK